MDQTVIPTVSFAPDIASTIPLTPESGAWLDDFTFEVTATVVDAGDDGVLSGVPGVNADKVTINITGAEDVVETLLQTDHTSTVTLKIDTLNPTAELAKSRRPLTTKLATMSLVRSI